MVTGGDEHGILTGKNVEGLGLKVGDTVRLIPGHIDPTVNMHEFLMVVDGGEGEGQGEEPKVVEIFLGQIYNSAFCEKYTQDVEIWF